MTRGHSVPLPCRILAGFLIVTLSIPPHAFANPQGGQVRQGQVRIQNVEGQLRVHQESQRAVIDWESFSIDRGEVTRFLQPNANAAALNRVRGAAASQIEGMLRANGKVYLINPNGVLIGPNGTIDVGGFVGSTLDTNDDDFMRGGDLRFAGNSDSAIINLGSISALDGDVVLMAGSVLNEGRISAPRGTAALAAGNDILLTESGEERVFVRGSGGAKKANGVTNTGEIEANIAELKAHGGNIYGMAVKNEGRVAATGVTRSGGQIFLSAGGGKVRSTGTLKAKRSNGSGGKIKVDSGATGDTEIGGTVDASGEQGAGGEIAILGNTIEVFDGTLILNDGATMGGTTRIGGGLRGQDPEFANAETVTVGNGAMISAKALGSGGGGQVIVFSRGILNFDGHLSVAGANGGQGGLAELSGQREVFINNLSEQVDLGAGKGPAGTLLIDPIDVSVINGVNNGIVAGTSITDGSISSFLTNNGNLVINTSGAVGNGDITFAANVNITWSTPNNLTFQADRDMIFLGGAQILANGSGAFNATAARSISVGNGASIRTTNGALTLSANTAGTHLDTFDGIDINAGTVRVIGSGNLTLIGKGGLGGGADPSGVVVRGGGAVIGGTTGAVSVNGNGGSGTSNDIGFSNLIGVMVDGTNSRITSDGAAVEVTGIGGTSTGAGAGGVLLINGGMISAGGSGSVTVTGTGGNGTRFNYGVDVVHSGSIITSTNGIVTVTGNGGTGALGDNWGAFAQLGGVISAGGLNSVNVFGTGGSGAGGNNHGVVVRIDDGGPLGAITSGGGNVNITGTEGTGGIGNLGISVQSGGTITTATNGGNITLVADTMGIANAVAANGTGTVTLRQKTNGIAINLGSTIDTTAGNLELSESELDAIVAGTLQIGNNNSGQITVSSGITHGNHLSLTTGAGVTINNAITMDPGKNSTLNAVGTVNFANTNADLAATGSGAISIMTARNISLASGASVTTVNGNLTLSANQQAIPTSGNFAGILIDGGIVESTGTGVLSAVGRGGDTGGSNIGISVDNGGRIIGGTSGITLLTGTGGVSSGSNNIGVRVFGTNSRLSTNNSNLSVFGYGGGTGAASASNSGLFVSSGGVITSGALGGVSVEGTGGSGGGNNNKGVWISQTPMLLFGTITSGGGFVSITGTGGGSGTSSNNQGVDVVGSNVILSTGGGALTVTGTAGLNTLTQAVRLSDSSVSTVGNQPITIIADSFSNLSGLVNSGTGITSIRPLTNNLAIDLGGADVGGTTLGLSDAELDFITAGTVQIGDSNTGLITVSSAITHGNHLSLTTGAGVTINNAITMASNRNFTTNAVTGINLATSFSALSASGAGTISLATARNIHLSGGSSVTTVNGNLSLSANQQTIATSGNFVGVLVNEGTIQSTGLGEVSVSGRGGDDAGGSQYGVFVSTGGQILGGTNGGTLSVIGTGGASAGDYNIGINVIGAGATISSTGGNVSATGFGGGMSGNTNSGVRIGEGLVSAGGGGTVTVTGYGEEFGGFGIDLTNGTSLISSSGGIIQINGFSGIIGGVGLALNNGSIVSGYNADIVITVDDASLGFGTINSGTGTTSILTHTPGTTISLGGGSGLDLNDDELDNITAGLLQIGNGNTGQIHITDEITHGNHLSLTGGAGFRFAGAVEMAPDRNLTIEVPGTIEFSNADTDISATGTGAISITTARNIVTNPGWTITTVDGNLTLSANQGVDPTPGSFSGIDLDGASISSTGTGTITLSGRGGDDEDGQHGILLRGGAALSTNSQNLTLSGAASDSLSSGVRIELASLGAGGGTIQLTGDGGTTSINSTDPSATIGSATDTVLVRSNSGDVSIVGQVRGADLQVQDYSGTESVDFALTNTSNDIDRINSFSNGSNGRIASLDFRDSDGFRVTEFLGASGVSASGNITLRSNLYSGSSVVVDHPVRSAGGNVLLRGLDVVIDGTDATTTGSGSLTLEAGRAILVQGDSLLSVTHGAMSLEANRSEGSLEGNFTGITILGSRVRSLGLGGITLAGTGGDGTTGSDFAYPGFTNPSSNGIRLDGGTVISSIDSSTSDFGIELYGSGGDGASDSVGIVIAGADTSVSSAGRSVLIEGFGGGQSTGQRNRGLLFTGGLVQASGNGNVTLFGAGGAGINENDGIQLNGNARVQAEDGAIVLDGYAGDTLGIGVILGNTAGDISITGSGSVDVNGMGRNAEGIVLGNSAATMGGIDASYVDLSANESDIRLQRNLFAYGNIFLDSYAGDVFVEGEVTSEDGDIEIDGDNITIDAPVTASNGNITLIFGDQPPPTESEPEVLEIRGPFFDGTATINDVLSADGTVLFFGGEGTGDLLTFAGYTDSEITLRHENLIAVELVVGTGSADDRVVGPSEPSTYQFTGPNAFNVGGVAYSAFENVDGGTGDDTFSFTGSATVSGHLDGGGGSNSLDYSSYATGVIIDLPAGAATGIVGGFENISNFTGSGNIDTITGPGSASTYEFTGPDALQVGSVSVSGFENLIAGPLEDEFVFLPGSSLRGWIDGGSSPTPVVNHLDYSLYGAPVAVNLAGSPLPVATGIAGGFSNLNQFTGSALLTDQFFGSNLATSYQITGPNAFYSNQFTATGFENLTGGLASDTFVPGPFAALGGRLSGGAGAGTDTLDYSLFGRAVTVNIGPNTATGLAGGFADLERIIGSPDNDRFNFLNQETIQFVDGGGGTDLLEINDSDLGGENTYEITGTSVSRNPLYTFNNFEALRLYLGRGNNTVNSGFFPFTQFIHGGSGFNTLNLPGVSSLTQGNPIRNVYHYGIDAPRPGGTDTGGLLQLEINQRNSAAPNIQQGFNTENRFSIVDPGTLSQQIGALSGAFAAAVTAQAALIVVDGNPYLVFRPFSLDGSGIAPSNLAVGALNESLGVDANLELAAAIGYTGPIFLFNPDGAHGLDLTGAPVDPVILTLLQESLAIAAAAELSAALGLNLVVSITATDGIVPTALDNGVPGQPIVLLLSEQLGDPAFNELNAALGAN